MAPITAAQQLLSALAGEIVAFSLGLLGGGAILMAPLLRALMRILVGMVLAVAVCMLALNIDALHG
jgi:hypothetical protein